MNRARVTSSNIFAVGHEGTTLEVQFHVPACKGNKLCQCSGGQAFGYAGVPVDVHETLIHSRSIGSEFYKLIRSAKNADGTLKYPATKL